MVKLTASEIIRKQFKGRKNFMSPNKLKIGKVNPNVAFELSSGRGFSGGTIYGVTIVSANKSGRTKSQYNISKAFDDRKKAEAYINRLKNKMQLKRKKK